jgi:hypothetical protein
MSERPKPERLEQNDQATPMSERRNRTRTAEAGVSADRAEAIDLAQVVDGAGKKLFCRLPPPLQLALTARWTSGRNEPGPIPGEAVAQDRIRALKSVEADRDPWEQR